jgi:16S rRNA (guanine1516-N2)-methyltransferase
VIKIANQCHYHKALARELIERTAHFQCADDFTLKITDEGIALCTELQQQKACFKHSLTDPKLIRRSQQKNQALLKACNNKKREIKSVADLTAGWGKDSLMLASHGQCVIMLEQNLLIFQCMNFLIELARYEQPRGCYSQMNIIHQNSIEYLTSRDKGFADCLYLDPMFPAHKSSAKPSKDLQILQRLTQNIAIDELFEMALNKAGLRVVVKRPLHADSLNGSKPDIVYKEKTIRFDVYLTR